MSRIYQTFSQEQITQVIKSIYCKQKIETQVSELILFNVKTIIDEKFIYFLRIKYLIDRISKSLESFKKNSTIYIPSQESNPTFSLSDAAINEVKDDIDKLRNFFYILYEYEKNCEELNYLLKNFLIIHQILVSKIQYELYGNFDPPSKELLYVIRKLIGIVNVEYTTTTIGCNIYISPFMVSFYHRDYLDLEYQKILRFLN